MCLLCLKMPVLVAANQFEVPSLNSISTWLSTIQIEEAASLQKVISSYSILLLRTDKKGIYTITEEFTAARPTHSEYRFHEFDVDCS